MLDILDGAKKYFSYLPDFLGQILRAFKFGREKKGESKLSNKESD